MNLDTEAVASRLFDMVGAGSETRATVSQEGTPACPTPWLANYFGGGEMTAGMRVTETTALNASSVFACVRNLAEDVAKLPLITYRSLQPRGKERLREHPLYRLLHDEPNPEMSSFDFRQAVTACAVLFGGGYAEIERTNGGTPLFLWPLEPWRVRARRDAGENLYYEVDGFTRLAPANVLHVKGFGFDGILGCMVAGVGKESLALTLAAQRFAAGFFGNGTRLSGILTHPLKLGDAARANLKRSWNEEVGGVENAWKVKVLEEGVKWEQTSAAPEEAQMLETRQFQVEDVARWFRMPPHKIGHLLRATGWSTLEATNTDYVIDTLMPWFARWEQEAKRKLVSPAEQDVFVEHLVNGLLRGDSVARATFYTQMRNIGVYSANDILEKENENPIHGGDLHLVPLNMTTLEQMEAAPPPATTREPPAPAAATDSGIRAMPDVAAVITDAHRPALLDAAARVLRREVEVIRRKAKNPEGFRAAVASFYAGHEDYVRTALRPAVTAYVRTMEAVAGSFGDAETRVNHAAAAHIAAASPDWLTEHVLPEGREAELEEWERQRAAKIVELITEPRTP